MPKLLQLNLLILLWSLTAILGEYLSLQPFAIVFWRTLVTAIFFFLYCSYQRSNLLRISRKQLGQALAAGFILGVHWLCFFAAIEVSNVSIGLAGFASTCLFTSLLEALLAKRRPDSLQLILALLVTLGIGVIVGAKTEVTHSVLGLTLALVGAFLAAVYSLMSKNLIENALPGPTMMAYQIPGAWLAATASLLFIPAFSFELPTPADWPLLLVLSLACTFAAFLWYAHLLRFLSAFTINLAINFEPVYGILMAAFLFAEYEFLTTQFYLGVGIIVLANVIYAHRPEKDS